MRYLTPDCSLIDASALLAEATSLAYEPTRLATNAIYQRTLTCGDAQLRLLVNEKHVGIIAIAGTNGMGDWAMNAQVRLTNLRGVYDLHSGFTKSAEQVLKAVLAEPSLPECFREGNYFITGHSLGGGTAAILPLLIDAADDDRLELPKGTVAFGSPKYAVGDCVLLWPCPLLHISSTLDVVSHLPTGAFVREWARAGQQMYVNDNGFSGYPGHEVKRFAMYLWRLITGEYARKLAGLITAKFTNKPVSINGVAEHAMDLYETRVKKGLQQLAAKREKLSNAFNV